MTTQDASRVALVTGGGKGIGLATARELVARGYSVHLAGRDEQSLDDARQTIVECRRDAQVTTVRMDVTDSGEVRDGIAAIAEASGPLSLLVNCAGVIARGPAQHLTDEEWSRVIETDLSGVLRCCRAAFDHLCAADDAAIVNVGSVAGAVGIAGRVAYTASKAGLEGLTRTLALEWASYGIRVNTVAPGWTRTEMVEHGIAQGQLDEARLTARIAQGRLAEPEEIARVVAFAGSTDASYVTGQTLYVDGGFAINGNS